MNSLKWILFLFCYIGSGHTSPPPCSEWQFLVTAHKVSEYQKSDGVLVRQHDKNDYCKEKWRDADRWAPLLKDHSVNHSKVVPWKKKERVIALESLQNIPREFLNLGVVAIVRGRKGSYPKNPASAFTAEKTIILYDQFFGQESQTQVVVHELAHFYFYHLSNEEVSFFLSESGWDVDVSDLSKREIVLVPPKKPIKQDSIIGHEEDFANHVEEFWIAPDRYKKTNQKLFYFFNERLHR